MIDPLPSDIFQAGEVLNNTYEVEGVLGRGGTGEVYRVVNKITGRVFAIKALNAQFSGKEDYVELMKREEEMRHIIHDTVVRYNECSRTDNGHVILVMDYVAGPSLAEAMVSRQVSEKELLIIAHRIAQGLEVAHAHGIVHRDLSPDNIILRDGSAEKATLIDFGIAKDTSEGARTIVGNDFAGKYEYAAPEQVDGRAEARSDLYALGATLLAAHRGETPFLGTTPGEIVRRKQEPLDVRDVPERLAGLIGRLAAPDLAERFDDAAAARDAIEDLLSERSRGPGKARRREVSGSGGKSRRKVMPLALAGLGALVLLVGGYFASGLFLPSLPVVQPYTLSASKAVAGRTMMDAHAPDQATADALVAAFVSATGAPEEAARVTLAEGMPSPAWASDLGGLMEAVAGLQQWELTVSDDLVNLTGLAADQAEHGTLQAALSAWQSQSVLSLDPSVMIGPETLRAASLTEVLQQVQTCGPLEVMGDTFSLEDTVSISGHVASESDLGNIMRSVEAVIGTRSVDVDATVLNEDVCAIRDVLPVAATGDMSIRLTNGRDGSPNLTGVYRTGENPVVDLLVPATTVNAFLWVMVVDNTGKVFHVLPNINDPEIRIENLGVIEAGVRRITVLHPRAILATDPKKLVVEVISGNYGKSEVIAILSREPLFEGRRPRDESTTSVKEVLTETLQGRETEIVGVISRLIDARE